VLAGVVMGGSGNIAGAILGGALISYIPDRLRGISDPFFHTDLYEFRFAIFGVMIIVINGVAAAGVDPEPAPGDGAQGPGEGGGSAMSEPHIETPEELDAANARPVDRPAPTGGPSGKHGPSGVRGEHATDVLLEVDNVTLRFGGGGWLSTR